MHLFWCWITGCDYIPLIPQQERLTSQLTIIPRQRKKKKGGLAFCLLGMAEHTLLIRYTIVLIDSFSPIRSYRFVHFLSATTSLVTPTCLFGGGVDRTSSLYISMAQYLQPACMCRPTPCCCAAGVLSPLFRSFQMAPFSSAIWTVWTAAMAACRGDVVTAAAESCALVERCVGATFRAGKSWRSVVEVMGMVRGVAVSAVCYAIMTCCSFGGKTAWRGFAGRLSVFM
jgi:hypothetical protein